jgi:RHS repeat-associated protein
MKIEVKNGEYILINTNIYSAEVLAAYNYYPFGMLQPGMYAENNDKRYRFGFNGMLRDDDVTDKRNTTPDEGRGNSYDFGARMYNPRVTRFFSLDPEAIKMPSWSPYTFSVNNPVLFIDPDGKYPISIHVVVFAPFNSFGPGNLWKGDGSNRPFTTNSASSRISMNTNYETESQVARSSAKGAFTYSKYGARGYSDAYLNDGQPSVTTIGNSWDLHLYGKNEAVVPSAHPLGGSPGGRYTPTWDIDIHNRLTINATDGVLTISGTITGDQFPSAEAYVTDDFGTSIFLGTFAASGNRQLGPVLNLAGDRDLPMIDVDIRISIGKEGDFRGVYSTDKKGNEIILSPN